MTWCHRKHELLIGSSRNNPVSVPGGLIHWGREKMAAISQTTFSYASSWMKMSASHILTLRWKTVNKSTARALASLRCSSCYTKFEMIDWVSCLTNFSICRGCHMSFIWNRKHIDLINCTSSWLNVMPRSSQITPFRGGFSSVLLITSHKASNTSPVRREWLI